MVDTGPVTDGGGVDGGDVVDTGTGTDGAGGDGTGSDATDVPADNGDAGCTATGTISCGVGACHNTVPACSGGRMNTCTPSAPSPEVCDGIDNDCNGLVDDMLGQTMCGTGACMRTVDNCQNGMPVTCVAGHPMPEICNGMDDDCNGMVDDGLGSTSCGVGACMRTVQNCVTGMTQMCVAGTPSMEICNGLDDDCDGVVDNGLGSTNCGVGACARTQQNCVNGMTQMCVPGTARGETCNGIDDDCNGLVDDGLGSTTCGVGACMRTQQNCVMGRSVTCMPGMPIPEICNGIDDNCDGMIDEMDPGGGSVCNSGLPGVCAAGVIHCVNAADRCVPTVMPNTMPETCNGLDDNCNGVSDEGDPGGGGPCSTGMMGVCQAGTNHCMAGRIQCSQNVQPMAEVCNGLDDNCNGPVDEGLGSTSCGMGACMRTQQNCVNGRMATCSPGSPAPEVCNNMDDNCDGIVDNAPPNQLCPPPNHVMTTACSAGVCSIPNGGCNPGTYDVDGMYSNGCECVDDNNPQACGSAMSLGVVNQGGSASVSGKIVPAGTSSIATAGDWFVVQFPPNTDVMTHGTGQPTIAFTANPGNAFRFELMAGCGGTPLSCTDNGPGATGVTSWAFVDDGMFAGNPSPAGPQQWSSRAVGWPGTVYIRVYRISPGLACDNYAIAITRP